MAPWLRALEHPGSVPGSSELPVTPSQGYDALFGVTRYMFDAQTYVQVLTHTHEIK